jgi:FkbM family methyltransferase
LGEGPGSFYNSLTPELIILGYIKEMHYTVKILSYFLKCFPIHYQNYIFEIILKYAPLQLILRLPFSYGIYLKCFNNRKGSVVIDCGAHIGNCALLFSRAVGPTGVVICLEPFIESYQNLKKRIKKLKLRNVIAINKGLWHKSISLPLNVYSNSISCKVTMDQDKSATSKNTLGIECITIDKLVAELGLQSVDFIKMDIEGAEIEALQGASNTLMELKPQVAIASYHLRDGQLTYLEVEKILAGHNYNYNTIFPPHLTTCGGPKIS